MPNSSRESFTQEQFDKRMRQDGGPPQPGQPPMHHASMMAADMRKQFPPRRDYPDKREDEMRGPPFPHGFGDPSKQQQQPPGVPAPRGSGGSAGSSESTITAANLIDAIITKQINMEITTDNTAERQKNSEEFFRKYGQHAPQQQPQTSPHMQPVLPPPTTGPGPSGAYPYSRPIVPVQVRPQHDEEEDMRKNGPGPPGRPIMIHPYQMPPGQMQKEQQLRARAPAPSPVERKDLPPQGYRPPQMGQPPGIPVSAPGPATSMPSQQGEPL